jgi:membrane protein
MEEIITIVLILLTMLVTFCLFKMLDKRGLYFSLVIMNLLGLVLSFKISQILTINMNIGIIPMIATLSIIYIFIIKYGYKETKNLLLVSLYSNIAMSVLLIIMNYFIPAITETVSINMQGTFEYNYKILIIYPLIMLLGQYTVTKLYKLISSLQRNTSICITLTYIITGLIYTIVFYLLAYINILEISYSIFLGISTYIIGIPITLINLLLINYSTKKKVLV